MHVCINMVKHVLFLSDLNYVHAVYNNNGNCIGWAFVLLSVPAVLILFLLWTNWEWGSCIVWKRENISTDTHFQSIIILNIYEHVHHLQNKYYTPFIFRCYCFVQQKFKNVQIQLLLTPFLSFFLFFSFFSIVFAFFLLSIISIN